VHDPRRLLDHSSRHPAFGGVPQDEVIRFGAPPKSRQLGGRRSESVSRVHGPRLAKLGRAPLASRVSLDILQDSSKSDLFVKRLLTFQKMMSRPQWSAFGARERGRRDLIYRIPYEAHPCKRLPALQKENLDQPRRWAH